MCGQKTEKTVRAIVQGVEMYLCEVCARNYGRILPTPKKHITSEKPSQTIVSDYAEKIKNAREKSGISLTMLARYSNEKESLLKRIEAKKTLPTLKLAEKLEKILKIKLITEETEEKEVFSGKEESLTLGDVVTLKKKR